MKNQILRKSALALALTLAVLLITSCSSVFSAGISGQVVDAESTSTPQEGIANVDVYVYTSAEARNVDYVLWNKSEKFKPRSTKDFIAHTTTIQNGEFTISKIVWEDYFPKFGKTADICEVYLLFYHENYGLTANTQIATIVSDATMNSVYQPLTKTRLQTVINLSVMNVATKGLVSDSVIAKVTVDGKTYKQQVNGSGNITVSYPRNVDEDADVLISVEQNGNDVRFYQPLTKTRLQTVINLSVMNVATKGLVSDSVIAKVTVDGKTYKQQVNGTGSITVSYPRNVDEDADVLISVEQNGNDVRFYQCFNDDTTNKYKFFNYVAQTDEDAVIAAKTVKINGDTCPISVYMKAKKVAVPTVSGTVSSANAASCTQVSMTFVDPNSKTIDCGSVAVQSVAEGNLSQMTYRYTGLGDGYFWEIDDSDENPISQVTATVTGSSAKTITLKSSMTSATVNF